MSKYLVSIAALGLLGAATIALPANAAEKPAGIATTTSHEMSSQRRQVRRGRVYARHYGGPRRYGARYYGGPAYGYGNPYPYYGYAPPLVSFGVGPFGLRVF